MDETKMTLLHNKIELLRPRCNVESLDIKLHSFYILNINFAPIEQEINGLLNLYRIKTKLIINNNDNDNKHDFEEMVNGILICKACRIIQQKEEYEPYRSKYYQIKHHIAEVITRLKGLEPNQPDLERVKEELNGDHTMKNIHRIKKYRKHLTYIYCELNDIEYPDITIDQSNQIIRSIHNVRHNGITKLPSYHYIIDRVCETFGYHHIQPFLFFESCYKVDIDKYISNPCYIERDGNILPEM